MCIVGKSGSGKTTLLKCLYGLEDLQQGEIVIDGERVLGPAFNLIPGHNDIKLVSQDFYVLDNHTVKENIYDKLGGYTDEYKAKRSSKILQLLELTRLQDTRAKYLSSGQKQRVAIARSIAEIPKLLLLDEPFSNLDKILTEKLYDFILKEVKQKQSAVILISHLPEEALKYADRIAVMDGGRILQEGEKWDVYYHPKNTKLAGLLGDFNILQKNDLEKTSSLRKQQKFFVRPDKIKLTAQKIKADLNLEVIQCVFNGKCFEILGQSVTGNHFLVYSAKMLRPGSNYLFSLEV